MISKDTVIDALRSELQRQEQKADYWHEAGNTGKEVKAVSAAYGIKRALEIIEALPDEADDGK